MINLYAQFNIFVTKRTYVAIHYDRWPDFQILQSFYSRTLIVSVRLAKQENGLLLQSATEC